METSFCVSFDLIVSLVAKELGRVLFCLIVPIGQVEDEKIYMVWYGMEWYEILQACLNPVVYLA